MATKKKTKSKKSATKGSKKKTGPRKSGKKRGSKRGKKTSKPASKRAGRKKAAKKTSKRSATKKTSKRSATKKRSKLASKRAGRKKATKKTSKRPAAKKASKSKKTRATKTAKRAGKTAATKRRAKKSSAKRQSAKKTLLRVAKRVGKKARKLARRAIGKTPAPAATTNNTGLEPGDRVPSFSLPDQDGTPVSSEQLAGTPYVIYFYPKDDTPGCTREACGFRDDAAAFQDLGVRVIGVSPDSPSSHQKFRQKYDLNFTLLSDEDKQVAERFGVWVKKKNYGREYMGIDRSTFVVDGEGVVRKAWRGVKVDGHVDKVREATRDL